MCVSASKNGSFYWLSCCSCCCSYGKEIGQGGRRQWQGQQDRKSLCGLGSKCHIDLLTCVNYCLVWLSASPCCPPAASAVRGQMINVSKFLEIARFEMVFEFISFHDGLRERRKKGESEIEAACPPKSVGSYSIMEIYAKTC